MGVITNTKPPCLGCSSRSITCHTDCEGYLRYRKQRDERNANVYKNRMEQCNFRTYIIETNEKARRRHGVGCHN